MPIAGPARSIPEDAIAAEVAAATAVSKKMSCGRKRAYLSVIAACLAAAALCACQSSEPGRKADSESSNLKVLKPYSGNQTFSQKKVLEILSEQEKFFDENPDFLCDYPISRDKMYLLRDVVFRGILRKIKEYEGGKRDGIN